MWKDRKEFLPLKTSLQEFFKKFNNFSMEIHASFIAIKQMVSISNKLIL